MIFQEPMTSLSPLHTIGDQISESYLTHIGNNASKARKHTLEVLARVGFLDPRRALTTYPFELSGGRRGKLFVSWRLRR